MPSTTNAQQRQDTADPLRLLKFVPPSALRVLDFGCGAGERARALKARGVAEVLGIETEASSVGCEGPDTLITGPLDSAEVPCAPGHIDCILADGAFARLRDPARVLARFRTVLAPGGLLLLSAPNVQHHATFAMLVGGAWTHAPEGPIAFEQIRYYTGYELHRLLGARGFASVKLMALSSDPASAFPRDEEGRVRAGRICVGPLTDQEHAAFLVREYLLLARAPDACEA